MCVVICSHSFLSNPSDMALSYTRENSQCIVLENLHHSPVAVIRWHRKKGNNSYKHCLYLCMCSLLSHCV